MPFDDPLSTRIGARLRDIYFRSVGMIAKALIALLEEPPDDDHEAHDPLDKDQLEARGITGVNPGEVLAAAEGVTGPLR